MRHTMLEGDTVTYSVSGDDAGKFSIVSNDGELTFASSPNFEALGSADGDNVYEVTVKAASTSSNTGATEKSATVDVTVEVTNVDEDGSVTLSASQPRIGIEIMANTPVDPDGGVTGATWQWERADDAAFGDGDNVTKIKDATNAGYTPVTADDTKFLRVTATYTDAEGEGKTAIGTPNLAGTAQAVAKVRNLAPVFTDEDDDADGIQIDPREVAEDAAATADVGDPVVATDDSDADITDDDDILYLLSGADATSFDIDSATGQITVGASAKLDHETNPAYEVTVTARDPEGLNSSVDVTIMITGVNEAPEIMLGGLAISGRGNVEVKEGETAVATYTAAGPESAMANWTLGGDDAGDFSISHGGVLTFSPSPNYEDPTDADTDNVYMVTVEADDGTYMDTHEVTVMVTNVEEDGTVTLSRADPTVDAVLTADLDDPDGGVTSTTWQWARYDAMNGTYADIDGATSGSYTPVAEDVDMYLRATASYTDGEGSGKSAMAQTANAVMAADAGDPLVVKYDANSNDKIEKSEVITAINDYLDGVAGAPSKADVIRLIDLYIG